MKRLYAIVILLVLALTAARPAAAHIMGVYKLPAPGVHKSKKVISDSITIYEKRVVPKRQNPNGRFFTACRLKIKGQPLSRAYSRIVCKGNTFVYSPLDDYMKCGILGRNGKPVTEPRYVVLHALSYRTDNGLSYYSGKYLVAYRDGKNELLDSLGNVILDLKYKYICAVDVNTLEAVDSTGVHYFNLRGEPVNYSPTPEEPQNKTLSSERYQYGKTYEIDDYTWLFEREWMAERFNFENQNYTVCEDTAGRKSLYDHKGRRITDSTYDYLFPYLGEWMLACRLNERGQGGELRKVSAEIIDCQGRKVVTPAIDLSQAVRRLVELVNPRIKVVDKTADYDTVLLLANFQQVALFPIRGTDIRASDVINNLRVKGLRDGRWQLLDRDLRPLGARTYDEIDLFYRKRAHVRVGDKWGLIDGDGNQVLAPIYDAVLRYCGYDNEFRILIKQNGKWGVADYDGTIIVQPIYDRVPQMQNRKIFLQKEGCRYLLNSKNELQQIPTMLGDFRLEKQNITDLFYYPRGQGNYLD